MGIDYGQTVVGNIGNLGKKIEFTAIGDTVNRASRLEGANKIYQTRICVSEAVYEQVCERFVFRRLDRIRVKGKTQSITIYELVGHVGHVASADIERIRTFERGLAQYLARDWDRARSTFETLARMGDMPSEVFAERSRRLVETGAPDDWDGVYQAEEK